MNLNSEIAFYAELRLVDKARLLNLFLHKVAERLVFNAYGRAIQGFESYDTTVLMGS